MLSSLLAALVLHPIQDSPRDVKLPIMSIQEFGEWLAAENGEKVIVSADVADRSVYVNVKQKTTEEILAMVERAVGVRVLRANGAVTLLPSAPASSSELNKFFEQNLSLSGESNVTARQVDDAIKKSMELYQTTRQGGNEKIWQELAKLRRFNPTKSLMVQLIRAIGIDQLRAIPDESRTVYSTKPTRLQRAWPVRADHNLDWLNQMCDAKNDAILKYVPQSSDEEGGYQSAGDGSGMFSMFGGRAEPIKAMMLVVTPSFPYFSFELKFYDESGQIVSSEYEYLQTAEVEEEYNYDTGYETFYQSLNKTLSLSKDEESELRRLMKLYDYSSEMDEVTRDDIVYMTTIDTRHPMSGILSKIYDFACESTGNQLVTEVFDVGYWIDDETEIQASLAAIQCFGYDKEFKNELVVVEQDSYAHMMRRYSVPRAQLAQLARVVLSTGSLDIDTLANAISQLPNRDKVPTLVTAALAMTGQGNLGEGGEEGGGGFLGLEIYARLSRQEREMVKSANGFVLEVPRMNQSIKWLFDDEVRRNELIVGLSYSELYSGDEEHPDAEKYYQMQNSWQGEQTVFLADQRNFPPRVHLKFTREEAVAIKVTGESSVENGTNSPYHYIYTIGLEEMGQFMYYQEQEKNSEYAANEKIEYSPSEKMELTTSIRFGTLPTVGPTFLMWGARKVPFGPYERLPEAVRQKINAYYEKFKRENGDGDGFRVGDGDGTVRG